MEILSQIVGAHLAFISIPLFSLEIFKLLKDSMKETLICFVSSSIKSERFPPFSIVVFIKLIESIIFFVALRVIECAQFDSSEKNTVNNLSGNDNLFSAQTPSETVTLNDNNSQGAITNPLNKAVNVAMQQVDGVTLSNAELQELEDGLTEVIKIAELSIHSIISQYREKGKKVNNQDLNSAVNEESAVLNVDSTNIFDNPSDSKRIA